MPRRTATFTSSIVAPPMIGPGHGVLGADIGMTAVDGRLLAGRDLPGEGRDPCRPVRRRPSSDPRSMSRQAPLPGALVLAGGASSSRRCLFSLLGLLRHASPPRSIGPVWPSAAASASGRRLEMQPVGRRVAGVVDVDQHTAIKIGTSHQVRACVGVDAEAAPVVVAVQDLDVTEVLGVEEAPGRRADRRRRR